MDVADEKIIELSKNKIVVAILGACLFVAGGLWLFQMDASEIASQRRFNNPLFVHAIAVATIGFFGLVGLCAVKKLFDAKPGLVLNASGIVDNASAISAGFIPWSEIAGFEIFDVAGQKTLIVKLTNPEKYVEAGGAARRALNRMNFRLGGSPVAIVSSCLQTDFNALLEVCTAYFHKYRQ